MAAAAASAAGVSLPRRLLPNLPPPPPQSTLRWRSAHRLSLLPSPPSTSLRLSRPLLASRSETLKNQEDEDDADEEEVKETMTTTTESGTPSSSSSSSSSSAVAKELKEMLAERKRKEEESPDLIAGVLAEVREIEWPAFSKVVGTTAVVLAVIAGSSVALLTVNAVLAELSDRIFAGRGLQDFFL